MSFDRRYFVITTSSGEAIGVVGVPMPDFSGSFSFTLQRVHKKETDDEFMDLSYMEINRSEFQTHRDAFETMSELEVVNIITDGMSTMNVLVKKHEQVQ